MASQISHIVYAQKVRDMYLSGQDLDEKRYFVGNLLPDIRHYLDLARWKTHQLETTPAELTSIEDDFKKGIYAHSLIDNEWERVVAQLRIIEIAEGNNLTPSVIKFIEDQYTYVLADDWTKYIHYFDNVLPEEIEIGSENGIEEWHQTLQEYFSKPPTMETIMDFALKRFKKFTPEVIDLAKKEYFRLSSMPEVMDLIQQIYFRAFEN